MTQRRFDWVIGTWNDWDINVGVKPDFVMDYQTSDTSATHLISNEDLVAKNDTLRVERVIGSVQLVVVPTGVLQAEGPPNVYVPGTVLFIKERIYVHSARDQVTTDTAQDTLGPQAFEDADRSFLWERTRAVNLTGMGGILFDEEASILLTEAVRDTSMAYTYIDVGVKRRLAARDLLIYQVQMHPYSPGGGNDLQAFQVSLKVWNWLRVGVKF